jgi:uncharacterized protein (UPF0276 family)
VPCSHSPHLQPKNAAARRRWPQAGAYRIILNTRPDVGFFEVHAENYMGIGSPPHRYLTAIAELYPISLYGIGLYIGGPERSTKTISAA